MSSRWALRYRYRVRCYDCPTPLRYYHSPLFWYLWEADQWLEEFPVGDGVLQHHLEVIVVDVVVWNMGFEQYINFLEDEFGDLGSR